MPYETFLGWQRAYQDCPWGEDRDDDRAAANSLMQLRPYMGPDADEAPNLHHPYWRTEEVTDERVARIEALKRKILDGRQLNRQTRNPPDDGHVGDGARL